MRCQTCSANSRLVRTLVVAEVVALQIGVVGRRGEVVAPARAPGQTEAALALDVAAEILARGRRVGVAAGLGGIGAAAGQLEAPGGQQVSIFRGQDRVLLGHDDRGQSDVVVGRQGEVVGRLQEQAKLAVVAEARRQEARLALDRRIRVRQIGRVGDRHAIELEERVAVGDLLRLLVMDDALRVDLPERRRVGVVGTQAGRANRPRGRARCGGPRCGGPAPPRTASCRSGGRAAVRATPVRRSPLRVTRSAYSASPVGSIRVTLPVASIWSWS